VLEIRRDYANQLIDEAFKELSSYKKTGRYSHYMQACEKGYFAFKQYASYLYDKSLAKAGVIKRYVMKEDPVYAAARSLHYLSFGSPDMADPETVESNLLVVRNYIRNIRVRSHRRRL